MITGLAHTCFNTNNLDAIVSFYRDQLELHAYTPESWQASHL